MKRKTVLVALTLATFFQLSAKAEKAPRTLYLATCTAQDDASDSFSLAISKVIAPKHLFETILTIGKHTYTSDGEYNPGGLNYAYQGPAPKFKREYLFASWQVIKGQSGTLTVNPDSADSRDYDCKIIGAQG